eukprot:CAMPEP_0170489060 /NCGR_PEP_ID=MMETSP0208-20121228/7467_1 /TAXON_ID=197538 /ORGANISM="Strombidium inclinatum, Strain S3" /LENGTH=84 /DNA_ID=CAMNT_0010763823 /DNA_START=300 /DNA_END=554 /DNA_ORIENTATION=+
MKGVVHPPSSNDQSSQSGYTKPHFTSFPNEKDHPYAANDPRNQYVQFNHKFLEAKDQAKAYDFNCVKPFFKTNYKKEFSPPKKN